MRLRPGRHAKHRRLWSGRTLGRLGAVAAVGALMVTPGVPEPRAGGIPRVSGVECVKWCDNESPSTGGDSGSGSGGGSGGLFNLIDRLIERAEENAAARRVEGRQQNERGVAEFNRGNYAEALRLFRLATDNDPDDAVIRQNVKNAEAQVARIEKEKKREEEKRKDQADFRKRMGQMAALMPAPKLPTNPAQAKLQARPVVPLPGFNSAQWQEYLDAKDEADRLYAKLNQDGALSDADSKAFYAALSRRNELWDQARNEPLDARQREQLRLPIAVVDSKIRRIASDMALKMTGGAAPPPVNRDRRSSNADSITASFVADFSADKSTGLIEDAAKDAVESARGKTMADRFENLLGLGRIAVAARENGVAGAAAETADLIISKLPEPMGARAEMATEGGRIYSNVAYQALNRFMVDSAKLTNAQYDPEAFRSRYEQDLTPSQKAIAKWIQFGN